MLAVNIEQVLSRLAHLLQRGAAPIDKAARTSVGIQHPAQQAHVRRRLPAPARAASLVNCGNLDVSNSALISARSQPLRTMPASPRSPKRQRQRINQDGIACAGLAGQRGEAGGKIEFKGIDNDKVADTEELRALFTAFDSRAAFSRSVW